MEHDQIKDLLENITDRGHLQQTKPDALAQVLATRLGLSRDDVMRYFEEAGYVMQL